MIQRKGKRNSDEVRVTFTLPADDPHAQAAVVGEFNQWDRNADPLKKRSNGAYSATVTLEKGQQYAFRYYDAANDFWFNDPEADAYEGDNGIIIA
jgi:1,4-alpha-glucan branching enzyme